MPWPRKGRRALEKRLLVAEARAAALFRARFPTTWEQIYDLSLLEAGLGFDPEGNLIDLNDPPHRKRRNHLHNGSIG